MITIIHGDDIVSSRQYYILEKAKSKAAQTFDGKTSTIEELIQAFESGGLFADSQKVFIEDFFGKNRSTKDKASVISYLNSSTSSNEIIFLENKLLSSRDLPKLRSLQVKTYKIPKLMFSFLDNIKPGNGAKLIYLFHKTQESSREELVLFMLIRHFRILLALSDDNSKEQIEEILRLYPWQRGKLSAQSGLFREARLKILFDKLFKIDLAQKTGELPASLVQAIDFFLLEI